MEGHEGEYNGDFADFQGEIIGENRGCDSRVSQMGKSSMGVGVEERENDRREHVSFVGMGDHVAKGNNGAPNFRQR